MTRSTNAKSNVTQYLCSIIGLAAFCCLFRNSQWKGEIWLHTVMEVVATMLALLVGATALIRNRAKPDGLYLMVGVAFLGTGLLDGYHAAVTSPWIKDMLPSELASLIPWSWISSRLFLSGMLLASWVYYRRQKSLGPAGNFRTIHIFVGSLTLTVLSGVFFAFVPLPRAYYPEFIFGRPEEFIPAVFFLLALCGFLLKGKWKTDTFQHWLVLSLIINLGAQVAFMSTSQSLFDFDFDAAHLLKKISYLVVLIGLYLSMFQSLANGSFNPNARVAAIERRLDTQYKHFQNESGKTIGITLKLVAGVSIVIILTSGIIGTMILKSYSEAVTNGEISYLNVETEESAALLSNHLDTLRRDTLFLSKVPAISGIIRASSNSDNYDEAGKSTLLQWKQRLGSIFRNMLDSNPEFMQIRYIGVAENGLELVRANSAVNNNTHKSIVVSSSELQKKGTRDYFVNGIRQPLGEIYYSNVNYRREHGEIFEPRQPTIRAVSPVFTEEGQIFGVIVINMNLQTVFSQLSKLGGDHSRFYVIDHNGYYIHHPEPDHSFGFEYGRTSGFFDDYPSLKSAFAHGDNIPTQEYDHRSGKKRAVGFAKIPLDLNGGPRFLSVAHSTNMQQVIANSAINPHGALVTGIIILGFALVFAWIFSITIANPLRYLAWAAKNYGKTGKLVQLPLKAGGEVGVMANALQTLQTQIDKRADELKQAIADQEKTNDQLLVAMEEANQATEAKSNFLATMSHEIRTPMNGLIGILDLMEDELPPESQSQMRIAQNSAESLLVLINDILDFSKIEAGKLDLETVEFDLLETMEGIANLHATNAFNKGLNFICNPDPSSALLIEGDPHRLSQIINNLINNAVKFTSTGEIELASDLIIKTSELSVLKISVRDTGIGIPPEAAATLFQAFTQVNASTTREFGGTGLGLSISQRIVELMGGEIGVNSTPGAGSTFWFTIPLSENHRPTNDHLPIESNKPKRILLAESNPSVSKNMISWFQQWNLQVDHAKSIKEVIALTSGSDTKTTYDFVLFNGHSYENNQSLWEANLLSDAFKNTKRVVLVDPTKKKDESTDTSFDFVLKKPVGIQKLRSIFSGEAASQQHFSKSDKMSKANNADLTDRKILLVDDNATNRLIASQMLAKYHGVKADTATNGIEAIEAMKATAYDLIFMDCMMPVMDGYEATRNIRKGLAGQNHIEIPIIALTANAMKEDRDACIDAGMTDYLAKPIRPAGLNEVISKLSLANTTQSIETVEEDPKPNEAQLVDFGRLNDIYQGDQELMSELLGVYLEGMEETMAALAEAVTNQPTIEAIRFHTHRLQGSSFEFGANALGEKAKSMEKSCINENLEEALAQFEVVQDLAGKTKQAIEKTR